MRPEQVKKLTRAALVLEVLLPPNGAEKDFVQIVQSIPGREGTIHRTWYLRQGRLDQTTWMDIQAFLSQSIDYLLETLGGAQQSLPI